MNDAALVIHRSRCPVLDRLRHIVDVDIIAEHLTRVAVFDGYRRTRKPDESRIWKRIADNTRVAHNDMSLFLAFFVLGKNDFLFKSVLSPVGFVGDDNDVAPFGKRLFAFIELEHRSKYDAVCRSPFQKALQMLFAFRLNGHLPQELRALGKLHIKLVVKVDSVRHHYNGRAVQDLLQQMRIKNHRQRLAAALRMPEHTAFTVRSGRHDGFIDSLSHGEILMISRHYLV